MRHLTADFVLLEDGFAPGMRVSIDASGAIAGIAADDGTVSREHVAGALLPGMVDLHSHAFQRGFAGRTEFAGGGGDFWSWRQAMYRAAERIEPETAAPIAAYLGMQLLRGGYTSLAEFHYLQHGADGRPYADRNAMAEAIVAGAVDRAGIGLTLLFGIYEAGGFDGAALQGGQIRFRNMAEDALRMLEAARPKATENLAFGLAPHSLRAVPPESLKTLVDGLARQDASVPIHIHVAEQQAEVAQCEASLGAAPVAWLLGHVPVGPAWCLIHATHTTAQEIAAMARSGAVAGLCPSTEANLGDGNFALPDFCRAGGSFGIGSDSNVTLDAFVELRLLEYAQRLRLQRRNLMAGESGHTGRTLWQAAARGGAQASGRKVGAIETGRRADFVVIEPTLETASQNPDFWLDAAMFASPGTPARHVMAGGEWVVRDGMHRHQHSITEAYRQALRRLD